MRLSCSENGAVALAPRLGWLRKNSMLHLILDGAALLQLHYFESGFSR